jgi:predicted nucleic acid-binding protein
MPRYYLDTSALIKRYHQESGSSDIDSLFADPANQLFISRLAIVESYSTFSRLVREGLLTTADYNSVMARINADVAAETIGVLALSSKRLADASALFTTHGLSHNLRTLDAIHLATAQALISRRGNSAFVAADKKLLKAANAAMAFQVVAVG